MRDCVKIHYQISSNSLQRSKQTQVLWERQLECISRIQTCQCQLWSSTLAEKKRNEPVDKGSRQLCNKGLETVRAAEYVQLPESLPHSAA